MATTYTVLGLEGGDKLLKEDNGDIVLTFITMTATLSGALVVTAAEPIIYMVTTATLSGSGTLSGAASIWVPSAERTFVVPYENRTYTVPVG